MATVVSFAQDVITCDLCDNPTKQFCNNCQVSLCMSCVSKHVDAHKTLAHDIVSFTNRKVQLVYTKCLRHPDQRCEAYCRKCDSPVCMKCILGPHKGHDAVEVSKFVDSRKKKLRKDNNKIETILIPKYTECEVAIRSKISEANTRFGYSANEIEKKRNLWHQEVDVIFDTMGSMLQSTKENHMDTLATRQASLRDVIVRLETQLKENKKILKSINMSEINNYKSNLEEYRNIVLDTDVDIPSMRARAVHGQDLSVELGEFKATLKQTSKHTKTPENLYAPKKREKTFWPATGSNKSEKVKILTGPMQRTREFDMEDWMEAMKRTRGHRRTGGGFDLDLEEESEESEEEKLCWN